MKPNCSIVIRAFNEDKHIGRLLAGINQQTVKNVQVILVDSGSTDTTVEIAKSMGAEVVSIEPKDFTFGKSLNLGISHAESDLVVIVSAHVYPVYPDWLENLLEPLKVSQSALSYGKQRGAKQTKYSEHQIFAKWYPDQSLLFQEHPFCNNANAAIKRELWDQHHYHEGLPGLEDLEWANWAFKAGYNIAYQADAEVIHVHNETWKNVYNRYRREAMAFKQIFPHEHFHLIDVVKLWVSNVSNDIQSARKQQVFTSELKSILMFRTMQFWGTYQGYRKTGSLTWQLKQAFYYPGKRLEAENQSSKRQVKPIHYHDGD